MPEEKVVLRSTIIGWAVLAGGGLGLAGAMVTSGGSGTVAPIAWFAASALVLGLGLRFGRAALIAEGKDLLRRAGDGRARVLYARPFYIDRISRSFGPTVTQIHPLKGALESLLAGSAVPLGDYAGLEDYLIPLLERIGPVDCLADPQGDEPAVGAWRYSAETETWKSTFLQMASNAQLAVVVVHHEKPAVVWEIEQLLSLPNRIPVVLMLSLRDGENDQEVRERYAVVESVMKTTLGVSVPPLMGAAAAPLAIWVRPPNHVGLVARSRRRLGGGEQAVRAMREALDALYPVQHFRSMSLRAKNWPRRAAVPFATVYFCCGILSGLIPRDSSDCTERFRLFGVPLPITRIAVERFLDAARPLIYQRPEPVDLNEPCRPDSDLAALFEHADRELQYVRSVHATKQGGRTSMSQESSPLSESIRSVASSVESLRPIFATYITAKDRPHIQTELGTITRELAAIQSEVDTEPWQPVVAGPVERPSELIRPRR